MSPPRSLFTSITFRVGLAIAIVQLCILTATGLFYQNHFSSEALQRIRQQVQLPGILLNKGLLSYDAIADRPTMQLIVGNDLQDILLISFDKIVLNSLNPDDLGKSIQDIPRLDKSILAGNIDQPTTAQGANGNQSYFVNLTPIRNAAGNAPIFSVYVKVGTGSLVAQERALYLLFFVGSLLAAVIAVGVLIVLLRVLVFRGITQLTKAAELIGQGSLDSAASQPMPTSGDEVGILGKTFSHMITDLQTSRQALVTKIAELERVLKVKSVEN